jgi:catechol 2,3-dioxygenase-like lactoylglutathione lyase family enzyme
MDMNQSRPVTKGSHHIGLTVSKLEESASFFVDVLGWSEVRRDPDYPAIFVTDGVLMVTLWAVKSSSSIHFDRKANVGLHHLALSVDSFVDLDTIHQRVTEYGLKVEFSPDLLRKGPAKHMMCYEPSGIRIEFICIPASPTMS